MPEKHLKPRNYGATKYIFHSLYLTIFSRCEERN